MSKRTEAFEQVETLLEQMKQYAAAEFDADTAASVALNAEARRAWEDGRKLVIGAYYQHHHCGRARRVLDLTGSKVMWADHVGVSVCKRSVFLDGDGPTVRVVEGDDVKRLPPVAMYISPPPPGLARAVGSQAGGGVTST